MPLLPKMNFSRLSSLGVIIKITGKLKLETFRCQYNGNNNEVGERH